VAGKRLSSPARRPRTARPRKTRVFISFDYDNDSDLRVMLSGQGKRADAPFAIADWSIKDESKTWKREARERIRRSDVVIVICGLHTNRAVGVAQEVAVAREEEKPIYLLRGRKDGWVRKPRGCFWNTLHLWTQENLRGMTTGEM
jgi:hypothetical protein